MGFLSKGTEESRIVGAIDVVKFGRLSLCYRLDDLCDTMLQAVRITVSSSTSGTYFQPSAHYGDPHTTLDTSATSTEPPRKLSRARWRRQQAIGNSSRSLRNDLRPSKAQDGSNHEALPVDTSYDYCPSKDVFHRDHRRHLSHSSSASQTCLTSL